MRIIRRIARLAVFALIIVAIIASLYPQAFDSCSLPWAATSPMQYSAKLHTPTPTSSAPSPVATDSSGTSSGYDDVSYGDWLVNDYEYTGTAYSEINDNTPYFTAEELKDTTVYIDLSELDSLGRAGAAMMCAGPELLPTEKRESLSSVTPSGWHNASYPDLIADEWVYNRAHLLMFALSGLQAEERNLITGTRYLNIEGMLPFEEEVRSYVVDTGNHVAYRVTPVYDGDNLVADGVLMEAYSIEDSGDGVSFCVYCYNVQPGITIDYATGYTSVASNEPLYTNEIG